MSPCLLYTSGNLIDLPCLDTVFSGSYTGSQPSCAAPAPPSAQVSQTAYAYDQSPSPSGARGNLTAMTRWLNGGTSPISKTVYNSSGMPIQKLSLIHIFVICPVVNREREL